MSPLKTALIVAVVSSALTAGVVFQLHQRRAREAGRLRWQNNQMREQANQRRSAEIQISQSPAVAPAREPNAVPSIAPAPAAAPTSAPNPTAIYHNEGQATPLATLQTFAWACDRGDAETVAKLLYLEPGARAKAEAYGATLPKNARAQWRSVDEMAAAMLTYQAMNLPFPNADVLATATPETISADRVLLHLPDTFRSLTEYLKTDTGWKYVITEKMADEYLKRASQPR
jgi:hypothetical protein